MSASLSYMGRTYDANTDWVAVIREAARFPSGPSWLRSDLDVASGLAELAEQVKGTPMEAAIANAALAIAESGSDAERAAAWQLPFERGTNAIPRLLKLIATDRRRLDALHGLPNVIWRLLQVNPKHPDVLAALRRERASTTPDPWIVEMASNFLP